MSNVIAFEQVQKRKPVASAEGTKSMTLFIHIKRATLIAHCGNLNVAKAPAQDRIGKSRI